MPSGGLECQPTEFQIKEYKMFLLTHQMLVPYAYAWPSEGTMMNTKSSFLYELFAFCDLESYIPGQMS